MIFFSCSDWNERFAATNEPNIAIDQSPGATTVKLFTLVINKVGCILLSKCSNQKLILRRIEFRRNEHVQVQFNTDFLSLKTSNSFKKWFLYHEFFG